MMYPDTGIPVVSDINEFASAIHRIAASQGATVLAIEADSQPGTLIVLEGHRPMPGDWPESLRLMGYRRMTHTHTEAGTELRVHEE